MKPLQQFVIRDGKIMEVREPGIGISSTPIYASLALMVTIIASGFGGYWLGQSRSNSAAPESQTKESNSVVLTEAASAVTDRLQTAVSEAIKQWKPAEAEEKKTQQILAQESPEPATTSPEPTKPVRVEPPTQEAPARPNINRVTATAAPETGIAGELAKAVSTSQVAIKRQEEQAKAAEEAEKTYEVRPGDTLWTIAQRIYGDPYQYKRLYEANPRLLDTPNYIFPGQVFKVPN